MKCHGKFSKFHGHHHGFKHSHHKFGGKHGHHDHPRHHHVKHFGHHGHEMPWPGHFASKNHFDLPFDGRCGFGGHDPHGHGPRHHGFGERGHHGFGPHSFGPHGHGHPDHRNRFDLRMLVDGNERNEPLKREDLLSIIEALAFRETNSPQATPPPPAVAPAADPQVNEKSN